MNLEQLYFIAEITAAIAVIISIIYLAIQIRNTRIQNMKEMHLDMSKFRSELTFSLASDKELSYIVAQGLSGKRDMDSNDYFRFSNFCFSYFIGYEVTFERYNSKDIDNDIAIGLKDSLNWWLSFPGVQIFWKNNVSYGFTKEFIRYVNDSINSINNKNENHFENQISFMQKAGERMIKKTKSKRD